MTTLDTNYPIPPQYLHAYRGPVVERRLSLSDVQSLCGFGAGACAFYTSDHGCLLIISNQGPESVATYRRHETAHCNGWAGSHPR